MKNRFFFLFFLSLASATAQTPETKKILDHSDAHSWNNIAETKVSADGSWVAYVVKPNTEGDSRLALWNSETRTTQWFDRADRIKFTAEDAALVFRIKPPLDTLREMRRRKVKKKDLPKDTLGILNLETGRLLRIPEMKSFSVPEKWEGLICCQLHPRKKEAKKDTTGKAPKVKKESKENGTRLLLVYLNQNRIDTLLYTTQYTLAKKSPALAFSTTGDSSWLAEGVYVFKPLEGRYEPVILDKGKYRRMAFSEDGAQLAFLADRDTSDARIRPWELIYWSEEDGTDIPAKADSDFLPEDEKGKWGVSGFETPRFSEDGKKLFFGLKPPIFLEDTTLLPEEIVKLEVWTWKDPYLYTEQNVRLKRDKERDYPAVYYPERQELVLLGSPDLPFWRFTRDRNAPVALAYTDEPHRVAMQWQGEAHKDMYVVNLETGAQTPIGFDMRVSPSLSPAGNYLMWWSDPDSAWFSYNVRSTGLFQLTNNDIYPYYNEKNDVPNYPSPYGIAGWLKDDEAVIVYDKNDLWLVDPNAAISPKRLTKGRVKDIVYRYIRLDPEEKFIDPNSQIFLHFFNEKTKNEGYAWLNLSTGALTNWYEGEFAFTKRPTKAREANAVVFTCQSFQTFPDLLYSEFQPGVRLADPHFKRISNVNPQQKDYKWGTIELVNWTSLSGEPLEGLLVKPEGFDSTKQYPMMVYFYEQMSDRLHRHQAPNVHRSSINWTIYASQGYLLFLPNIKYTTGYPGKSAYEAVLSGVNNLINKGYVDEKRIGLQGHSWGGYQIAYIVTRTNLFACAEAGAPVANMTSAYGGIRWRSGLNRQFQYEHTQSRIGGTLWEYPNRYIENSPLFALDKVETPLLILHNDKDGAVPWYQGIELFTGLRRLGKPCWMLNYNGEPHWPVKLQNRIDFQNRMLEFFDHYLKDKPRPAWMDGIPAIEKGRINSKN